jgi:signal transduction histidine kinase
MAEHIEPALIREKPLQVPVALFVLVGFMLAYIDRRLMLNTLLLEFVHALVVTSILLSCLVFERRHPHIRHFGWSYIVWGIALLMLGTWIDIIDDPVLVGSYDGFHFPLGPSWERSFLKTTLGYTAGIGLFASGLFQWIPWMIRTRLDVQKLNHRLSITNRNLNRAMMSLDEHIESERVAISRELHDDVAQQLTFVNVQIQLCRKDMDAGEPERLDKARHKLEEVAANVSDALKSVRQISGDLRPESLFSLGLIPALEQFIEKLHHHHPNILVTLAFNPLDASATHTRLEKQTSDQQLLHLFRIIQEGVRNAIKHGDPAEIEISLNEVLDEEDGDGQPRLRIRIEDNGKGLPWEEVPPDDVLIEQGHLGIVGLQERVRELMGTFRLSCRKTGPGACLEIVLVS